MKIFFSYSHRDEAALDRLRVHLAVLRRDKRIEEWYDRDILAGGEFDTEIAGRLESFNLFIILVSPDFLASDYCVEREMERALERHNLGDARVVPIILEPCDWMATALGDLKALPKDGKPISEWPNENKAFSYVVQQLRRILDSENATPPTRQREVTEQAVTPQSGTRRYRVKRDFDDIDRSKFRHEAFSVIRNHFELAVTEIDAIDDLRGRFVLNSSTSFTCTIVNNMRRYGTAHITVHRRSGSMDLGDITFSFSENAQPNTANGIFTIEADEYELYLSSLMGIGYDRESFTPEAAAERLWEIFLEQAGITSD